MIKCSKALGEIIERKERYLTPSERETVNVSHGKLILLEEMEEQGRLIILPCKVGDTVYKVVQKSVDLTGYRMEWGQETVVEAVKFRIGMIDSVGETVFLTREEAETAMMKREKA